MKRTNPPIEKFGVFAYHAKGYARKSAEELATSADLTLEPWGRVAGTVTVLGKPLADVPIRFTLDATDQHSMFYDVFVYDARTDHLGRFTVDHVPAGVAHVSTGLLDPGPYGIVSSAGRLIKPGETLTLNIGCAGRPVVGRLSVLDGVPGSLGGGALTLKSNDQPEPPGPAAAVRKSDGLTAQKEMEAWDREKTFLYHFDHYRSPEGLAPARGAILLRSDPRGRNIPGRGCFAGNIHTLVLARK